MSERRRPIGLLHGGAVARAGSDTHGGTSGANQAGSMVAEALLRYCDEVSVHRFVPVTPNVAIPRDESGLFGSAHQQYLMTELPALLKSLPYVCLHNTGGPIMDHASALRHLYATVPMPVTSIEYAVSYAHQIHDVFVRALFSDLMPYDAFVCPGESARKAMENVLGTVMACMSECYGFDLPCPARLEVVPFGVDCDVFRPRDRTLSRRELLLPESGVMVLCVGRFTASDKMDLQPLLLAFKRVLDSCGRDDVFLVLAGAAGTSQGPLAAYAADLGIGGSVIFRHNLSPAAQPLLYSAADLFVLPGDSPQETFGLVLLEAAAAGLPAVVPNWDGYPEIVRHGETGLVVDAIWAKCDAPISDLSFVARAGPWALDHLYVGQSVAIDVGGLQSALVSLVGNAELRENIGAAARQRMLSHYTWKRVAHSYVAMWQSLCEQAVADGSKPRAAHLWPRYWKNFGHLAGRTLRDDDVLRLTPHGRAVLKRKAAAPMYAELGGLLDKKAVSSCLLALLWAQRARIRMTVADALKCLGKSIPGSDRGLMHVLWMLKYDLVSLDNVSADERA